MKLIGLAAVLMCVGLTACDRRVLESALKEAATNHARINALHQAQSSAPRVQEFLRLFPHAKVGHTSLGRPGIMGYDLSADLYERYEVRMQLPVTYDSSNHEVTGYGDPMVQILEAGEVRLAPGGGANISILSDKRLSVREWDELVRGAGSFAAIGYPLTKDRPVEGFKERKNPR